MSDLAPKVYYSNGAFLLFDTNHAHQLRRHRLLSQPVAGNPSIGPYCLSPYAARVAAKNKLATFRQLERRTTVSSEENRARHELKLEKYIAEQKQLFINQRLSELKHHNVEPTPKTIGNFDATKVRLPIADSPDSELTSLDSISMNSDNVLRLIDVISDQQLNYLYNDLYEMGFYVSSGIKFGCDFLAYLDDPVRYHAQYAVRLVPGDQVGQVDLNEINICDINSLQRLTHGANKIPLLATVIFLDDNRTKAKLNYWTLKERVYMRPDSDGSEFEHVQLDLSCPSREEVNLNKVRKTS